MKSEKARKWILLLSLKRKPTLPVKTGFGLPASSIIRESAGVDLNHCVRGCDRSQEANTKSKGESHCAEVSRTEVPQYTCAFVPASAPSSCLVGPSPTLGLESVGVWLHACPHPCSQTAQNK